MKKQGRMITPKEYDSLQEIHPDLKENYKMPKNFEVMISRKFHSIAREYRSMV